MLSALLAKVNLIITVSLVALLQPFPLVLLQFTLLNFQSGLSTRERMIIGRTFLSNLGSTSRSVVASSKSFSLRAALNRSFHKI